MKLLVLGGTVFLGRHVVEAARARGHDVALFNRGRQNAHLFPELEKLRGDRTGDVSALRGRCFDAVVDLSGYTPADVRPPIDALGEIGHYTFVSTLTVYAAYPPGRAYDESNPVRATGDDYGALKARSEELLQSALPGRVAVARAGLIVGPYDPTDRFTYWPRRIARGGDVLAPGRPERPVQFIDARDLASWCVRLAETRTVGTFNAMGYEPPLTMGTLLDACRSAIGSDTRLRWLDDESLLAAGVARWTEMPLWIPEAEPRVGGMLLADTRRARAAGLTFRPLADTILDTLAWDRTEGAQPAEKTARVTPITAEREARILATMTPARRD